VSVSSISNSSPVPNAAPSEDSDAPAAKPYTGNPAIDGMIANGTASILYGCNTPGEILDRLTGKTPNAESQPSSAAAGTLAAGTRSGLW